MFRRDELALSLCSSLRATYEMTLIHFMGGASMIDRGIWLLTENGGIEQLPEDPGSELYFAPGTMPEKEPGRPTAFISPEDAYHRFTLRDGPLAVAIFYARADPSPEDKIRLLDAIYSSYGRD